MGLGLGRTKDVIIMEDVRDAGRGTRAALVGSILGAVPAVALGFLRFALKPHGITVLLYYRTLPALPEGHRPIVRQAQEEVPR